MEKLAYKVEEAAEMASIGRSTLYELMSSGELESFKIGRARLIPRSALVAYIERRARESARGA